MSRKSRVIREAGSLKVLTAIGALTLLVLLTPSSALGQTMGGGPDCPLLGCEVLRCSTENCFGEVSRCGCFPPSRANFVCRRLGSFDCCEIFMIPYYDYDFNLPCNPEVEGAMPLAKILRRLEWESRAEVIYYATCEGGYVHNTGPPPDFKPQ